MKAITIISAYDDRINKSPGNSEILKRLTAAEFDGRTVELLKLVKNIRDTSLGYDDQQQRLRVLSAIYGINLNLISHEIL